MKLEVDKTASTQSLACSHKRLSEEERGKRLDYEKYFRIEYTVIMSFIINGVSWAYT